MFSDGSNVWFDVLCWIGVTLVTLWTATAVVAGIMLLIKSEKVNKDPIHAYMAQRRKARRTDVYNR